MGHVTVYRCVVMVGMPYPNIKSPELQEKMAYLDQTLVSICRVSEEERTGPGRKHCDTPLGLDGTALLCTNDFLPGGFGIYL